MFTTLFRKKERELPLTQEEIQQLQDMIENVEALSSAEFKIILVRSSWMGLTYKARELFKRYGLEHTTHQNAVLIVVDYLNKRLVLFGGRAVYKKMGRKFWFELRDMLTDAIKIGSLFEALSSCINILGHRLPIYYPIDDDDVNEISNELIFEE